MKSEGFTIWITGLPGSGKTSIADGLRDKLAEKELKIERLDGEEFRKNLSPDLGFSREDRDENIRRATYVSKLLNRQDVVVIVAFVSPYLEQRQYARKEIGDFVEVFINTPLELCEERDTAGLYRSAREGKIKNFTGISDPYEKPEQPEIEVKTAENSQDECVDYVLKRLETLGKIPSGSGYTPDEEQQIADRLKSLGYL